MSTYTDLHNKIKENIAVDYNTRLTNQQVKFLNSNNEYKGIFKGSINTVSSLITDSTLSNVTINGANLSNVSLDNLNLQQMKNDFDSIVDDVLSVTTLVGTYDSRIKELSDTIQQNLGTSTTVIQENVVSVSTKLDNEISDRQNADTYLSNVLIPDYAHKLSTLANTTISEAITIESTHREEDIDKLQININSLDNKVDSEIERLETNQHDISTAYIEADEVLRNELCEKIDEDVYTKKHYTYNSVDTSTKVLQLVDYAVNDINVIVDGYELKLDNDMFTGSVGKLYKINGNISDFTHGYVQIYNDPNSPLKNFNGTYKLDVNQAEDIKNSIVDNTYSIEIVRNNDEVYVKIAGVPTKYYPYYNATDSEKTNEVAKYVFSKNTLYFVDNKIENLANKDIVISNDSPAQIIHNMTGDISTFVSMTSGKINVLDGYCTRDYYDLVDDDKGAFGHIYTDEMSGNAGLVVHIDNVTAGKWSYNNEEYALLKENSYRATLKDGNEQYYVSCNVDTNELVVTSNDNRYEYPVYEINQIDNSKHEEPRVKVCPDLKNAFLNSPKIGYSKVTIDLEPIGVVSAFASYELTGYSSNETWTSETYDISDITKNGVKCKLHLAYNIVENKLVRTILTTSETDPIVQHTYYVEVDKPQLSEKYSQHEAIYSAKYENLEVEQIAKLGRYEFVTNYEEKNVEAADSLFVTKQLTENSGTSLTIAVPYNKGMLAEGIIQLRAQSSSGDYTTVNFISYASGSSQPANIWFNEASETVNKVSVPTNRVNMYRFNEVNVPENGSTQAFIIEDISKVDLIDATKNLRENLNDLSAKSANGGIRYEGVITLRETNHRNVDHLSSLFWYELSEYRPHEYYTSDMPLAKGFMYYVSADYENNTTNEFDIEGVELEPGDYLIINKHKKINEITSADIDVIDAMDSNVPTRDHNESISGNWEFTNNVSISGELNVNGLSSIKVSGSDLAEVIDDLNSSASLSVGELSTLVTSLCSTISTTLSDTIVDLSGLTTEVADLCSEISSKIDSNYEEFAGVSTEISTTLSNLEEHYNKTMLSNDNVFHYHYVHEYNAELDSFGVVSTDHDINVPDSLLIKDEVTNKIYKLVVNNGSLVLRTYLSGS